MCTAGRMQVQGICSHRLLHRGVVETPSKFRDLTCGDLEIPLAVTHLGTTISKKTKFVCLLDLLVEGRRRGGVI